MFAVFATVMAVLSAALDSWVRFPLLGAAVLLLMLTGAYLGLGLRASRQK